VTEECREAKEDVEVAIRKVHAWNTRKRDLLKAEHIRAAWNTLQSKGWLN